MNYTRDIKYRGESHTLFYDFAGLDLIWSKDNKYTAELFNAVYSLMENGKTFMQATYLVKDRD